MNFCFIKLKCPLILLIWFYHHHHGLIFPTLDGQFSSVHNLPLLNQVLADIHLVAFLVGGFCLPPTFTEEISVWGSLPFQLPQWSILVIILFMKTIHLIPWTVSSLWYLQRYWLLPTSIHQLHVTLNQCMVSVSIILLSNALLIVLCSLILLSLANSSSMHMRLPIH